MEILRPTSQQPAPAHAKRVFQGIMFDTYQWEQELFDGTMATFEKVVRPDTVVVFPVLDDGRILLTRQEQPGTPPFIGATGGRVDAGEDILTAAKREFLEESGYEAREFVLWHAEQPVAKIEWAVYVFIAKGLTKVDDIHLDGGERIDLYPVTFEEFLDIGLAENFSEREIVPKLFEAKLDPRKKETLRERFKPLV